MKSSKQSRPQLRRYRERRRLAFGIESLETRMTLTTGISFNFRSGLLAIDGSTGNDAATGAL